MSYLDQPARALDGSLQLGGLPASELAASYGTPLIVIDLSIFEEQCATLMKIAQPLGIEVAYAAKAFLVGAFAQRLTTTPLLLDCCSLGEVATAEAAGFAPERIYLHGCGKSTEELEIAVEGRVGRIIVDGFDELYRLAALSRIERPLSIVLRFNSGIEAHTHECIRTGGDNTKFGFALADAAKAFAFIAAEPALRFVGLHSHIGSQILDSEPFIANLEVLMPLYIQGRAAGCESLEHLIVGGGFAVPMHPDDFADRLDLAATLQAIATRAQVLAQQAGVKAPSLGIEPGRFLIAEAGTTLYRVIADKTQGARRFLIVDGGMNDNPRPALYDAYHHPQLASRLSHAPLQPMTLCGRACENDELVEAALPQDIRVGDLIAMRVTGAYTFSMASNYNRFTRPAVVFVHKETHRLVVRRETIADVMRCDLLSTV